MEFNFNINNYFKEEITKIGSRLIPDGFIGDRREIQDCLSKISYILTILGEKSAKAQGLQKVITSGEKLRNSDHVVYVLTDPKGGAKGYGTVVGMLKMGAKHLYVFDAGGNNHEVTTKCVLDFYVHESKQRMGLGKKLFQYMLKEERVDPVHLAIDKPSSKFLSFLLKHYGLQKIIPQMNNFVVFEGFFSNRPFGGKPEEKEKIMAAGVSTCGGRYSSGTGGYNPASSPTPHYQSASSVNLNSHKSYYGRPAPHKPVSTMGMILQHKPATSQQPPPNGSTQEEAEPETQIPERENDNEPVQEPDENENTESQSVGEVTVVEEEEKKEEVEEEREVSQVSFPVTPTEALRTPDEGSADPKRLNSQGHLDLKFYHSSLW